MTNAVTKLPQQPQPVAVSDMREMSLNYLVQPQVYDVMWRLAQAMAGAGSMPKHLKNNPGDCFRIIEFANRIGQSPFALADSSFEIGGKIGYDGKAIAAMVNACPKLEGSLRYEYEGEGKSLAITVIGRLRGEHQDRRVRVTFEQGLADSRGARERWSKDGDQMLVYYGARRWARRHTPEVILGMYSYDELRAAAEGGSIIDITPTTPAHNPATGEVHEPTLAKPAAPDFWSRDSYEIQPHGDWQRWQLRMKNAVEAASSVAALDKLEADNLLHLDSLRAEVEPAYHALVAKFENARLLLQDNESSVVGDEAAG
jgi:hypothetical protein